NWAAFVPRNPPWVIFLWWPLALAAWQAVAIIASDRPANRRNTGFGALLLCWLFVPPLIAWTATTTDVARLFFRRYLLASAPAVPLVAALAVALAPWNWAKLVVSLAIFIASFTNSGMIEQ